MRARGVSCLAVVAFIIAACGGSEKEGRTPAGGRASCAADSDCVVADHSACCRACNEQPFGLPLLNYQQVENKCAVVECQTKSDRIECPKVEPKEAFVAICKEGTCAVKKK